MWRTSHKDRRMFVDQAAYGTTAPLSLLGPVSFYGIECDCVSILPTIYGARLTDTVQELTIIIIIMPSFPGSTETSSDDGLKFEESNRVRHEYNAIHLVSHLSFLGIG